MLTILALVLLLSVTLDFFRHVYLPYDHSYWWEHLQVGWLGEEISAFTARHISAHIPGIMVNPIHGWEWIHYLLTLSVIGLCLGAVWLLGRAIIRRFEAQLEN